MSAKFLIFSALVFGLATCQTQQTFTLDGNDKIKLNIVFQPEQQQSSSCATGNCGQTQQVQASPCSTGNCGQTQQVQQSSPCASGNCGQTQQVQQSSPCASGNCGQTQQVQASPCSTGNCGQQVQQTSSCSTGNCGQTQQVQASPCSTGNCPSYDSTTTTTQAPITIPIQSSNVKVIRIPSYSSGCSSSGCNFFRPRCPGCARRRFFYPPPPPPRFFSPRFFSSSSSSGSIGIPDTVFANGRAYNAPLRVPSSYQDGNPVFSSSG